MAGGATAGEEGRASIYLARVRVNPADAASRPGLLVPDLGTRRDIFVTGTLIAGKERRTPIPSGTD